MWTLVDLALRRVWAKLGAQECAGCRVASPKASVVMYRRKELSMMRISSVFLAILAACGGKSSATAQNNPGTGTSTPGTAEVAALLNPGLTANGLTSPREPQLAEAVPSTENGFWKVLPDTQLYDAPNGNVVGKIDNGFNFVGIYKQQDGFAHRPARFVFLAGVGGNVQLASIGAGWNIRAAESSVFYCSSER